MSSPQTKSFIIILIIAAIGTLFSVWISDRTGALSNYGDQYQVISYPDNNKILASQKPASPQESVSTDGWQQYTDNNFNFSFKYPPAWKVLQPAKKTGDFYILEIDPGKKFYNIKIYISPKDFYALAGLPLSEETIAGAKALNLNDSVYGIKTANFYYTFDIGWSMSLKPDFVALVHSVNFF